MNPSTNKLIPRVTKRKRALPLAVLVVAVLILVGILGWAIYTNLQRQQMLVKELRMETGETLIHSLEASARSTLYSMGPGAGISGLVEQSAEQNSVAFIVIIDARGRLIAASGSWQGENLSLPVTAALATKEKALAGLTRDAKDVPVFMVAREFQPIALQGPLSELIKRRFMIWSGLAGVIPVTDLQPMAIFVGLYTDAFDKARRTDTVRNVSQGVLLTLFGSIALVLLFVGHGSRVARETLNTMELYTRNVIDSMPAGLLTLDAAGLLVSYNARAIELLGIEVSNPEGQNLQQLIGSGGGDLTDALGEQDEILEAPVDCHRLDGTLVPIKISASRLQDDAGQTLGTVLILRDMREIRAMEEQVERSRRHAALGRMATGIAHEIRNPLGTLKGFAQYFARIGKGDQAAEEYAALMVGEVDRLNRTISALLQYARPREPEFQKVDLTELLQRTSRLIEGDMHSHEYRFELNLPQPGTVVVADPDLMTQVLLNLLQNAMAATEPEGLIRLAAKQVNPVCVRIEVEDSGQGIDTEQLPRIFDPFFTTRKTGTGLGLAVVHQIIDQHGGTIEVESEVDRGTRMVVTLPMRQTDDE